MLCTGSSAAAATEALSRVGQFIVGNFFSSTRGSPVGVRGIQVVSVTSCSVHSLTVRARGTIACSADRLRTSRPPASIS
jgi:hypothetical protein